MPTTILHGEDYTQALRRRMQEEAEIDRLIDEKQIIIALQAASAVLRNLPDISTNNLGTTVSMTTRRAELLVNLALQSMGVDA